MYRYRMICVYICPGEAMHISWILTQQTDLMPSPLATVAFLSNKFAKEFFEKVVQHNLFLNHGFQCFSCVAGVFFVFFAKALLQSCFLNRSGVKWRWLMMLVWHSQAWKGPLIATYCYPADVFKKNVQVVLVLVDRAYQRNSPGAVVVHLAYNPSFLPTHSLAGFPLDLAFFPR